MDAKQFLAEFGHIANAPGGVQRLRELILQLGVSGQLLNSYSSEKTTVLYESILAQRERLARKGEIKLGKPFPIMDLSYHLFDIPLHWLWVWLGEIGDWGAGATPNRKNPDYYNGETLWLKSGELNGSIVYRSEEKVTAKALKETSLRLNKKGDVMVAMYGATIGKTAIAGEVCTTNQAVCACTPFEGVNNEYLHLTLKAYKPIFIGQGSGGAQPNISREKIINTPMPLPPLEEQSRIVAKVDELMALCDKLEAQQQKKRKLQNKLRQSVLQAVANAESPKELQDSWERLAGSFSHLFAEADDVEEFKNLVFDLSLRGYLSGSGQFISNSPTQESIPQGWSWTTLGELSEYITSGSRGWKKYHANSGATFIRSQDIRTDSLSFENRAYVSLPEKVEGKRTLVKEGDLLITITGGNVGKCALVPNLDFEAYVSQHIALIRLNDNRFSRYIHYWIIDAFGGRKYLSQFIYGDKPGLNLGQVGSIPIPIPPFNQISEIVSRLDYYHNICNELAEKRKKRITLSARLATAAIASLTDISTTQQEEPATMDEVLV